MVYIHAQCSHTIKDKCNVFACFYCCCYVNNTFTTIHLLQYLYYNTFTTHKRYYNTFTSIHLNIILL